MSENIVDELKTVAADLRAFVQESTARPFDSHLSNLEGAAREIQQTWSGSNLGYQSRVYYEEFNRPPEGAHFSREWGFIGMLQGTTGNWKQYDRDVVVSEIYTRAGIQNLDHLSGNITEATRRFSQAKSTVVSILTTCLALKDDKYIADIQKKVEAVSVPSFTTLVRAQMITPNTVSRDTVAIDQGWQGAPHQDVIAQVTEIRAPYVAAGEIAELADSARSHLVRSQISSPTVPVSQLGTRVFIGHGRSPLWRELKDYIQDSLGLPVDEFNKVQTAGITTVTRLTEMLDHAAFAFLIMTAEDETAEGTMTARANVIHEVGLFQGRLGFEKAIILLEDGCEDFSNVNGLTQLRFPKGRISAEFHNVQQVLKREGLL